MIAALFVEKGGVYFSRDDVDPWPQERDARKYRGPHPVIAHPLCERWGRMWYGGMFLASKGQRRMLGDDEGVFASAIWSVRTFGGVLEHPADSRAWPWFNLPVPKRDSTWSEPDRFGGRSAHVEQGHYGHRARKATWLYAVRCAPLPLIAGKSTATKRIQWMAGNGRERHATPVAFRDLLIDIASSARPATPETPEAARLVADCPHPEWSPKVKSDGTPIPGTPRRCIRCFAAEPSARPVIREGT